MNIKLLALGKAMPSLKLNTRTKGASLFSMFCVFVIAPTLIALFYYGLVESNSYVSEAKIVVRKSTYSQSSAESSSFLSKIGIGGASGTAQDGMIVIDYVKSRRVIDDVGGRERLRDIYDSKDVDWFSRLDSANPIEDIWDYWKNHVTVSLDTLSGIITVRVRAYDRQNAQLLNRDIVAASERLLNTITDRSRQDALSRSEKEVEVAARNLSASRTEMLGFQQKIQSVNPIETAKTITEIISTLNKQRLEYEAQSSRDANLGLSDRPGKSDLEARIESVNGQIRKYQDLLVGKGNAASLSEQLKEFDLLSLQVEFNEKIYSLARQAYEEARRQLDRQELYLGTVVAPVLPDEPTFPDIVPQTMIVLVTAFILWAICSLVLASIRDSMG